MDNSKEDSNVPISELEDIEKVFDRGASKAHSEEERTYRRYFYEVQQYLLEYSKIQFGKRTDTSDASNAITNLKQMYIKVPHDPALEMILDTEPTRHRLVTCSKDLKRFLASNLLPSISRGKTVFNTQLDAFSEKTPVSDEFLSAVVAHFDYLNNSTKLFAKRARQDPDILEIAYGALALAEEQVAKAKMLVELAKAEMAPISEPQLDDHTRSTRKSGSNILSEVDYLTLKAIWHMEFDNLFGKANPVFDEFQSKNAFDKDVKRMKKKLHPFVKNWNSGPKGRPPARSRKRRVYPNNH
jgi:hypothetical protein